MTGRADALRRFLDDHGWSGVGAEPLPADASFRRYYRLRDAGRSALAMDAPPPVEQVGPFVETAAILRQYGYRAPEIYAADSALGFLLIEDFGDQTFARALAAGRSERDLYLSAVDVLIDLHRRPPSPGAAALPSYDAARFQEELDMFVDWYLPAALGHAPSAATGATYRALWRPLIASWSALPQTLVLRDFHIDNLMALDRPGLAGIGLLDFQDAVRGPAPYDLVSLLGDARRDVSPDVAASAVERYCAAAPRLDRAGFDAGMASHGVQRALKILGVFTRKAARDGMSAYLRHIPRLWRLIDRDLAHPSLHAVRDWLAAAAPVESRIIPPGFEA